MNRPHEDLVKVVIANRWGSVEHYYHFLLGFCVPLVRYYIHDLKRNNRIRLAVRECGPLTRILTELPLNLEILPKAEHLHAYTGVRTATLRGFDHYRRFSHAVFSEFREFIRGGLPAASGTSGRISLMLIERESPDPYYQLPQAETRGGGTARRAILNHAEFAARLKEAHPGMQNCRLANLSIFKQYQLFHSADAVIAQHGAALSNIIFMKEGATVFEIGGVEPSLKIFKILAHKMKLRYFHFPEPNPFPVLDTRTIPRAITAALQGASGAPPQPGQTLTVL